MPGPPSTRTLRARYATPRARPVVRRACSTAHRAAMLHTYATNSPDIFGIRAVDRVLPASSMYHACAWGLPYCATMAGATLILPGPHLDGASLYRVLESERATIAAGVPTIWLGLLSH